LELLNSFDFEVFLSALGMLFDFLVKATQHGQFERVARTMEEHGGLDLLEELRKHSNETVHKKAQNIIWVFFSNDGDTSILREAERLGFDMEFVLGNDPANGSNIGDVLHPPTRKEVNEIMQEIEAMEPELLGRLYDIIDNVDLTAEDS
jgi:Atypical Arm repeat